MILEVPLKSLGLTVGGRKLKPLHHSDVGLGYILHGNYRKVTRT